MYIESGKILLATGSEGQERIRLMISNLAKFAAQLFDKSPLKSSDGKLPTLTFVKLSWF
jgi:hypothetical protein